MLHCNPSLSPQKYVVVDVRLNFAVRISAHGVREGILKHSAGSKASSSFPRSVDIEAAGDGLVGGTDGCRRVAKREVPRAY